ncbi:MAG: Ig-like domain-containing protein [Parashewanella sp.]
MNNFVNYRVQQSSSIKSWFCHGLLLLFTVMILSDCGQEDAFVDNSDTLVSIQVSPSQRATQGRAEVSLAKGNEQKYIALGTFRDGSTRDLSDSVTWNSSNTSAVKINREGVAIAITQGMSNIQASLKSIHSNLSQLTVTNAILSSLQITPANHQLFKGTSQQFRAIGSYSDDTTVDLTNRVTWTSSDAAKVGINNVGLASAQAEGEIEIRASMNDIVSNTARLSVIAARLVSIQVTPAAVRLAKGITQQYVAMGTYSDNSTMDISNSVTWRTTDDSKLSINAQGSATANNIGQVSLQAIKDGVTSETATVTVTAAQLVSIQITPPITNIAKGLTLQYSAIATYTDNTTADISTNVNWHSSDTDKVTINQSGLATTVTEGDNVSIRASMGNINSNNAQLTVTAAELTSIQITPPSVSIAKGLTQQYTAIGTFTDNSTANISNNVSWHSGDTNLVTISQQGLATAISQGDDIIIRATMGQINSNNARLSVTDAELTSIQVTPSIASIAKGLTQQYTAIGTYTDNSTIDISNRVDWHSDETNQVTISRNGLATAVTEGVNVAISASLGDVSNNTARITVTAARLVSLQVTPAVSSIAKGLTQQYVAMGTYTDNRTIDLSDSVSWHSVDTAKVTISRSGLATAVLEGADNVIRASMGDINSNNAQLTVTAATLTSIQITPAVNSIAKGLTIQYTATGTYTDNSTMNISDSVSWHSADTDSVTVNHSGLATAVAEGANIAIRASMGDINSNNAQLTVTAAELTSIQITPPTTSIAKGLTQQFTAIGTYTDNNTANISSAVNWHSTDTNRVTISTIGLAAAVTEGVDIGIRASMGDITSNTARLTVTAAVLASIQVTPAVRSIAKGLTQQYTAMGTFTDNRTVDMSNSVSWHSADAGRVTISNSGLATAVAEGANIAIRATMGTVNSNNAQLTVTSAALTAIQISPPTASLPQGTTQQYSATGTYTDNSTEDISDSVDWSSSDTDKITINASGLASAVSAANNIVIRASKGGINSNDAQVSITVNRLTAIQVTPVTLSLAKGLTRQYTAIGTYEAGNTVDITNMVSWNSNNTDDVTISSTGLATAANEGTAMLRASSNGINSNNVQLTVTAAVLASIQVTPLTQSIAKGLTQQYVAMGVFTDNSTTNISTTVSWHSSDTGRVTISNSGLATAVEEGDNLTVRATMGTINSNNAQLTVTPAALREIQITPLTASLATGLRQQYTAMGTYTDNSTADITNMVNWNIAGGASIITRRGLAISFRTGTNTVTARLDGVTSNEATLTATPAVIQTIRITPDAAGLLRNGTLQLNALARYTDNREVNISSSASWSSSDTGIVTISNSGLITGVAIGNATITVAQDGIMTQRVVNVVTNLGVCGGSVNDTDLTNASGPCLKVTESGNKWFTATPSLAAMQVLGYSQGQGNGKTYHSTRTESFGDFVLMTQEGSNDGQFARYCQDLADESFNGRSNWRRPTRGELRALHSDRGDMRANFGWANTQYYWADPSYAALLGAQYFDISSARASFRYYVSCVSDNP